MEWGRGWGRRRDGDVGGDGMGTATGWGGMGFAVTLSYHIHMMATSLLDFNERNILYFEGMHMHFYFYLAD